MNVTKANEYLKKCMDNCSDKLSDPSFFAGNKLQSNALRGEGLRDISPRCGCKMPAQWSDGAKRRGWGMWIFSGGTAEVFGHCRYTDCPRRNEFLRTAPRKEIRKLADIQCD